MDIAKGPHLVTGATGFVGSAVVRALIAEGAVVHALVRKGSDRKNLDGLSVKMIEGDLLNPASLRNALDRCVGLFHVAADYRLWAREPEQMFRANVDGTREILRAAHEVGVKRAVYTSSVAVLGIDPSGAPSNEDTPVTYEDMIGVYKQSKYRAEEAAMEEIARTGLDCVIVNPSTPIGPRDIKPTPTGRLVVEAASGRMPAYVDTGLNVAHVDDVAVGHLLAYQKGERGRRYILGGDDMSLREILNVVVDNAGVPKPLFKIPRAPLYPFAFIAEALCQMTGKGEPFATIDGLRMSKKKMFFSSARAETELGYGHRSGIDALHDAITWFRDNNYLSRS